MAISKRVRFEVFKRDSFTCQYCGKKAPDVILHVDHIEPRAKGGTDEILNLITSCEGCNSGKSDKRLSDDTVIAKQHAQLAALQERQEQLAMLLEWQRSLAGLEVDTVQQVADFWCELSDWHGVSEHGKGILKRLIRRHGTEEVLEAMRKATSYFRYDKEGNITQESSEHGFNKLGGICSITRAEADKPWLKDAFYVRAILRNRYEEGDLSYLPQRDALEWIETAFSWGADFDALKRLAKDARSWSKWRDEMADYIIALKKSRGAK